MNNYDGVATNPRTNTIKEKWLKKAQAYIEVKVADDVLQVPEDVPNGRDIFYFPESFDLKQNAISHEVVIFDTEETLVSQEFIDYFTFFSFEEGEQMFIWDCPV